MQAKFVIAKFLWKRTGLAKVGVKGIGSGQSRVRATKARMAKCQGGKCKGARARVQEPLF